MPGESDNLPKESIADVTSIGMTSAEKDVASQSITEHDYINLKPGQADRLARDRHEQALREDYNKLRDICAEQKEKISEYIEIKIQYSALVEHIETTRPYKTLSAVLIILGGGLLSTAPFLKADELSSPWNYIAPDLTGWVWIGWIVIILGIIVNIIPLIQKWKIKSSKDR